SAPTPDLEPRPAGHREVGDPHTGHPGPRRACARPVEQRVDGAARPLGLDLDTAVRGVAHPARDPEALGLAAAALPVPDALHPTGDDRPHPHPTGARLGREPAHRLRRRLPIDPSAPLPRDVPFPLSGSGSGSASAARSPSVSASTSARGPTPPSGPASTGSSGSTSSALTSSVTSCESASMTAPRPQPRPARAPAPAARSATRAGRSALRTRNPPTARA